jgi:hypothetical protein
VYLGYFRLNFVSRDGGQRGLSSESLGSRCLGHDLVVGWKSSSEEQHPRNQPGSSKEAAAAAVAAPPPACIGIGPGVRHERRDAEWQRQQAGPSGGAAAWCGWGERRGRRRKLLLDLLIEDRVAFFVIDEGHTISTWGRTFRPKLTALGEMLDALVAEANGYRRRAGAVGQLRRANRLVVTATCAPHAEQVLARSFSLKARAQEDGEEDEPVMTLRAPSRRFNIELNTLELQNGGGAEVVCETLFEAEADQTQGERGTSIGFAGTVKAACSLVEKLCEGS